MSGSIELRNERGLSTMFLNKRCPGSGVFCHEYTGILNPTKNVVKIVINSGFTVRKTPSVLKYKLKKEYASLTSATYTRALLSEKSIYSRSQGP